jgi:hypothetical protein
MGKIAPRFACPQPYRASIPWATAIGGGHARDDHRARAEESAHDATMLQPVSGGPCGLFRTARRTTGHLSCMMSIVGPGRAEYHTRERFLTRDPARIGRRPMKSAMLDETATEPVTKGAPLPLVIPGGPPRSPRDLRKVAETIETSEYRAILCCSIGKSSD